MQNKHSIFHNINILSSVFHVKNFNLVSYAKRFSLWPTTVSMTCKKWLLSNPSLIFSFSICESCPDLSPPLLPTHQVQCASVQGCSTVQSAIASPFHCKCQPHTKCNVQVRITAHHRITSQSAISSSFYCKYAVQCILCNFQSVTLQCPMYIWLNCIAMQSTFEYIWQNCIGWNCIEVETALQCTSSGIALQCRG